MISKPEQKKKRRPANMIGAGFIIGAGVGVAIDNIGLGIGVGIIIGAALSRKQRLENKSIDDDTSSSTEN
jgi:hypothetical protein